MRSLAQRSGFSPSFLSQVELGQSSPSLASLQKICDSLEIELPDLLRDPDRPRAERIVRKAEREAIRSEWSRASAESLLPNSKDAPFSALLLSLDRGGQTGTLPVRPGSRSLAYCIRGTVMLAMEANRYELSSSDSVLLDQSLSSWENVGRGRAEVLVISLRAK